METIGIILQRAIHLSVGRRAYKFKSVRAFELYSSKEVVSYAGELLGL